jgi:hypothetical protein
MSLVIFVMVFASMPSAFMALAFFLRSSSIPFSRPSCVHSSAAPVLNPLRSAHSLPPTVSRGHGQSAGHLYQYNKFQPAPTQLFYIFSLFAISQSIYLDA